MKTFPGGELGWYASRREWTRHMGNMEVRKQHDGIVGQLLCFLEALLKKLF